MFFAQLPPVPDGGATLKDWVNWLVMALLAAAIAYLKQTKHNAGEPIQLAPKPQDPNARLTKLEADVAELKQVKPVPPAPPAPV